MKKWGLTASRCQVSSPRRWASFLLVAIATPFGVTKAFAETAAPVAHSSAASTVRAPQRVTGIQLDAGSGWSVGLEGYAGLTTISTGEATKGHGIVGGVSRARFSYVELGAGLEASDDNGEHWRTLGGFAGAYLPLTNWIDIDATLGLALRSYVSTDTRYGPNGTTVKVPALTLRLGISDRTIERLLSPRLGAALLVGIDLGHRDVSWSYGMPGTATLTGVTQFGGVTAGLVMSFGFDVALRSDR